MPADSLLVGGLWILESSKLFFTISSYVLLPLFEPYVTLITKSSLERPESFRPALILMFKFWQFTSASLRLLFYSVSKRLIINFAGSKNNTSIVYKHCNHHNKLSYFHLSKSQTKQKNPKQKKLLSTANRPPDRNHYQCNLWTFQRRWWHKTKNAHSRRPWRLASRSLHNKSIN